jgi:hypothetical protein
MNRDDSDMLRIICQKLKVALTLNRFLPLTFRLSTFGLLFTINYSFLIIQCGIDVEDSTPPSPPVWSQKSTAQEWPECGIDAHESGGIFLELRANRNQEDVNSYHIYRALYFEINDSLGDFEHLIQIEASSADSYSYVDDLAEVSTRYFYYAQAEDNSGSLSMPTDTITYALLKQVQADRMSPNNEARSVGEGRSLSWIFNYDIPMENYTLTILGSADNLVMRRELAPIDYVGGTERFFIPDSIPLFPGRFYFWRVDMGANYIDGMESSGSESEWAIFQFR